MVLEQRVRRAVVAVPIGEAGHRNGSRPPYEFLIPSLVLLGLVIYLPLLLAAYITGTELNQYTIGNLPYLRWVGLTNFIDVLSPFSPVSVLQPLRTSIGFSLLTTLFAVPLGIGAALLANERFPGRSILRTIMLLPFIMPAFVIGLLWRLMFQTGSGAVDTVLGAIVPGMDKTLWLLGPNSFAALVITDVWAAWPFVYIMVLAALQSIQSDLYDAAAVDGAGPLVRFRAITIPSIAPTLALAICLSTINHFNNFTLPFTLFGNPAPVEANVMPLEIFSASFTSFDFGRAAAIAVVNLLVLVIPSAYYLRRVDASTS